VSIGAPEGAVLAGRALDIDTASEESQAVEHRCQRDIRVLLRSTALERHRERLFCNAK
jgi:hypothetical protein